MASVGFCCSRALKETRLQASQEGTWASGGSSTPNPSL